MYSTHLQQCPWCEVEKKLQPPQPKPQPQLQLQPKSISRFGDKRGLRIIKMAVAVLLIFLAVKSLNSTNPNSIHAVDKNEAGAQNTAAYNETAVSPVGRIANGNVVIANWYVPYMKYTDSVSNVTSLKVNLEIWGITSGTPYGQWQLYYRDESGKWIASERFNVQNETTRVVLSFQEPITFDALSIIRCSKELCYHSYEFDFSDFRAVAE